MKDKTQRLKKGLPHCSCMMQGGGGGDAGDCSMRILRASPFTILLFELSERLMLIFRQTRIDVKGKKRVELHVKISSKTFVIFPPAFTKIFIYKTSVTVLKSRNIKMTFFAWNSEVYNRGLLAFRNTSFLGRQLHNFIKGETIF